MAVIRVFAGPVPQELAHEWSRVITVGPFENSIVMFPGVTGDGQQRYMDARVVDSAKIYVPANMAACIVGPEGVEAVLTKPGGYEYRCSDGPMVARNIVFISMLPVRGIKFGTASPLKYYDKLYADDLEVRVRGTISLRVGDVERFITNFMPANMLMRSFDMPQVRARLLPDLLRSFAFALRQMSEDYRMEQLPAETKRIVQLITQDGANAGKWWNAYGLEIVDMQLEYADFTPWARDRIKKSRHTQPSRHWFVPPVKDDPVTVDEQIEALTKFRRLVDEGVITEEEFEQKKRRILEM